jgi:Aminotransferase class-V
VSFLLLILNEILSTTCFSPSVIFFRNFFPPCLFSYLHALSNLLAHLKHTQTHKTKLHNTAQHHTTPYHSTPHLSTSRHLTTLNNTPHHTTHQSLGKVAIDVQVQGIDLLTIVGHKYGAPKGIAALYIREGIRYVLLISVDLRQTTHFRFFFSPPRYKSSLLSLFCSYPFNFS